MEKTNLKTMPGDIKENMCSYIMTRYAKGATITSISKDTGIHRATVSRWVNKKIHSFKPGRIRQFALDKNDGLRNDLLKAMIEKKFPIWSCKSIQQYFSDTYGQKISLYHAKKIMTYLLSLPPTEQIIECFEKPYLRLDRLTPSEFSSKYKIRCNYLLQTNKLYGNKWHKRTHIICSPRGDIRFSYSSFTELFNSLLNKSKNDMLMIYLKGILSKDEVLDYSKKFRKISFVCSEEK